MWCYPYADAHLGHGRCYVNFDVVYRTLRFLGYSVNYVRNITDVDDKIVRKAQEIDESIGSLEQRAQAVAQRFSDAFAQDMAALHVCAPDSEPTVSGHIDKIISFIEELIAKEHAYAADGDVYFDISSLTSYGSLSKKPLDEMVAGARVQVNTAKRSPGDFVLWKGGVDGSFWNSPWGAGRPGWHIECSTFAYQYLGKTIDIHGGGQDLIFPHHENECAQSEALTSELFVRYWLHNAHVTLRQEKMSKSLGNSLSLRDLFKEHDPAVLRFYLLQHHYRTPIDFAPEHLDAAARAYGRLVRALNHSSDGGENSAEVVSNLTAAEWMAGMQGDCLAQDLLDALCDDFNTSQVIGIIFAALDELSKNREKASVIRVFLQQVLGLPCAVLTEKETEITPEIQELIDQRTAARAARDWIEADRLRDELQKRGYKPKDGKV